MKKVLGWIILSTYVIGILGVLQWISISSGHWWALLLAGGITALIVGGIIFAIVWIWG